MGGGFIKSQGGGTPGVRASVERERKGGKRGEKKA